MIFHQLGCFSKTRGFGRHSRTSINSIQLVLSDQTWPKKNTSDEISSDQ